MQVDAAENQAAEQKQQEDQQAKGEDSEGGQAEADQPATLKKAQTAAAARKDGEEVGSSGQALLVLCVQRLMRAQAAGFECLLLRCFSYCLCLHVIWPQKLGLGAWRGACCCMLEGTATLLKMRCALLW